MVRSFIAVLLLAGTCFAQSADTRMDQIVQSFVSNKQFNSFPVSGTNHSNRAKE